MSVPTSWRIAPVSFDAARALATELGVSDTLAQILVRRGFTDPHEARAFLHPDYRVYDPYRMAGIAEARKRIDTALKRSEPIAVHGDYDADGITATFLMVSVLEQLGADVRSRLPNRFSEGYGVAAATVEELAAAGVKLLITVDCGIGAREEVALARSLGMDVIVTDHHEIEGPLPDCIVVTPQVARLSVPSPGRRRRRLQAGARSARRPRRRARRAAPGPARPHRRGGHRHRGRHRAAGRREPCPRGHRPRAAARLAAPRARRALEVAGVKADSINAGTVGFRLGPRLNAAGRLEDASLALDLLGSADRKTALPLALRLNELNQERQAIEAAMVKEAEGMVTEPLPPALVLSSPDWHEGVVGIVASRVAERFGRPVVLLSERGDEAKGSGRSIPGFDLLGAVEAGAEHLLAFGGHRAACGLRLRRDRLAQFRAAFVAAAGAALTDDMLVRTQRVDAVVCGDDLTLELADELELLAPHGMGNPKVGLLLHDAQIVAPRLTRDHKHLQYKVRCDGASCSAIHFNFSGLDEVSAPGRFDVPLSLGKNAFNGAVSVQVQVSGLHRLPDDAADLCATACDLGCERRLTGEALWRYLLDAPVQPAGPAAPLSGDGEDASPGATMPARIHDRRGRPVVSSLTALAATGERVLVLVADVARRRPLLSRDVLPPQLGRDGMYVQCACASRVDEALAGPHVVMAGLDLAAAEPRLAAAFPHVAFVDPPFTRRLFADITAAAPQAWIHTLWGRPEVDFATKVAETGSDLQAVSRGLWRALQTGSGRFDEGLELALLGKSTFLRPAGVLAAALRTLREADLLRTDGLEYELQRPAAKVDVTTTESYRTWHTRFQTTRVSADMPDSTALTIVPEQYRPLFDDLFAAVEQYDPNPDRELITRAFVAACVLHGAQSRKSGEAYIHHPVGTALNAAELKLDSVTIAAALLHDVVEDTGTPIEWIDEQFGPQIAMLVDGVTKLTKMHFTSQEEEQAENYRKMIIAMATDIRVILIKLCDRLHNMHTLCYLSKQKQIQKAKETLEVYAPLAHRLGIHNLKWQLEDLAFSALHPRKYQEIQKWVAQRRADREDYVDEAAAFLLRRAAGRRHRRPTSRAAPSISTPST